MVFGKFQIELFSLHKFFFRTLIILSILTLLLCIVFKFNFNPHAYFDTVNFGVLFLSYFILSLQFISFCMMNAQLFQTNIRAGICTVSIYILSLIIYSYMIFWPTSIQYPLIFLNPFIASHSLFQVSEMIYMKND